MAIHPKAFIYCIICEDIGISYQSSRFKRYEGVDGVEVFVCDNCSKLYDWKEDNI